jgi:hypothetical protein
MVKNRVARRGYGGLLQRERTWDEKAKRPLKNTRRFSPRTNLEDFVMMFRLAVSEIITHRHYPLSAIFRAPLHSVITHCPLYSALPYIRVITHCPLYSAHPYIRFITHCPLYSALPYIRVITHCPLYSPLPYIRVITHCPLNSALPYIASLPIVRYIPRSPTYALLPTVSYIPRSPTYASRTLGFPALSS